MKSEVRRGRKFVEYHDPETQDEFTFTQEISGADVSYQDESGNWLPADENWATDGVDGFVLKNDKLNHKVRLKGNGGRRWYPRRNVSTEYLTFGIPQFWNGKRWKKFGFNGYSVEGKTITLNTRQGVTILVHNRWNGIKIDWVLASSAAPSRMRYPVSLTGITYVDGIIYGADGERLGQLTPTTATDANGAELVCSGSYAGGYVEFQADVSSAQFPVVIDPDFAGETGDSYIGGSNADYATARSTYAQKGNSHAQVECGQYISTTFRVRRLFFLFDTSTIGAGSTVTQANLNLSWAQDQSLTDFDLQIVEATWDYTDAETSYDNCLAGDTAAVWKNTSSLGTQHVLQASPNLTTSWVSKTGTTYYSLRSSRDKAGTEPSGNEYVVINMADNSTESRRPTLTVTYSAGSTGTLRRTNMNAQMSNLTGGMHG